MCQQAGALTCGACVGRLAIPSTQCTCLKLFTHSHAYTPTHAHNRSPPNQQGPVVVQRLYSGAITPEMKAFPKWKFAIMGLLDTLFNIFSTFPISKIGGSLTNVLSQTVLPINMIFAFVFLGTRFKNNHMVRGG